MTVTLPRLRTIIKITLLGLLLLGFALVDSKVRAQTSLSRRPGLTQLVIKFNHNSLDTAEASLASDSDIFTSRRHLTPRTFTIKVPQSRAQAIANRLSQRADVTFAEEDAIAEAFGEVNDPLFSDQWNLHRIGIINAWDQTNGDSSVKIAILDSGIDNDHPDISQKVTSWANFTDAPTGFDLIGHGTHVAGIAAAATNNDQGVAGAGYNATLISGKVLADSGYGRYSWISDGIYWAVDQGAQVINLSLGGRQDSQLLRDAVNYAWESGAVITAAAGNSHSTRAVYPAYYQPVIAVAATDHNNSRAFFTNYGDWVDIAAPGVSILSTVPNQPHPFTSLTSYGEGTGTSMASPHVAAVAALLASHYPSWNNAQIRSQIESTADPITGTGRYWSNGLVNAAAALGIEFIPTTPPPTGGPAPEPSEDEKLTRRRERLRELVRNKLCILRPSRCQ